MNSGGIMLNLIELEQFVVFSKCGTLSKASEMLHISQPTLTRSMKHIEESFGATLFNRGKNRIELNSTGKLAAQYAEKLLADSEKIVKDVQDYERSLKTITVFSCAPAPLWSLLPTLSSKHPKNTISSKIANLNEIVNAVLSDRCDIGILPYECPDKTLQDVQYISEHLSICVPKNNELSKCKEVTFEQLNGYNCLLRDEIGFWTDLCKEQMPASRFLIQTDEFEFMELVKNSTLFHFITDLANPQNLVTPNRVSIPIVSEEANVTYHLVCKSSKKDLLKIYNLD